MWRRTAPFHVQLELDTARGRQRASGQTRVRGQAIRVFRTDGRLTLGDQVEFPLWVCQEGDEPTGPAFIYVDAFERAAYMEAYFAGNPPDYRLAAYEFCVIPAPSERPVLIPEELEEPVARFASVRQDNSPPRGERRWRFWKRKHGA